MKPSKGRPAVAVVAIGATVAAACTLAAPAPAATEMRWPLDAGAMEKHFEWRTEAPLGRLALLSPGLNFVANESGTSRIVKGAPYSADAVSESTQVLMDGNKILRRSAQRLARDGEGRTRIERLGKDGKVESVVINDVVAGRRYWLSLEGKRAIELPKGRVSGALHLAPRVPGATPRAPLAPPAVAPVPPAPPAPPAAPHGMSEDEARSWAVEMRRWAREFTARLRPVAVDEREAPTPEPAAAEGERTAHVIVRGASGDEEVLRSVDVDVVRVIEAGDEATEAATAALAALPPLPLLAGPGGQGVTTSLGSKEFDRVRADGSRTTWTIAAGRIGNEKPIDIVSERWYAPDLLLVVSSRYFDPRSGETTYRLAGLKRGEPDPALFKVPSDFEMRPARRRGERAPR